MKKGVENREILPEMVHLPAGNFLMGGTLFDFESPIHQVTISSPFFIGKYEVTQTEWVEVMENNPSRWKGNDLPVETVSWYNAIEYCNKRSIKENLTPAYTISRSYVTWNKFANGYRLPTESEWEYAARSGGKDTYEYAGNDDVESVAWYADNSGSKTHPVGMKLPNDLGLYDMSGNVWEWCWDYYGLYNDNSPIDPMGPNSSGGRDRSLRGGCMILSQNLVRVAHRGRNIPVARDFYNGLRVARSC
ncbi:MAG: formylglycine-generating enzyme family protein [Treponema sp.]|jgi:formylglycine-generating enzyme required for sulfatase activity|nr:formylglycine-generating enzyme family protein [Treponema sp.]